MCHDAAGLSTPGRRCAHCRGHLGDLCLCLEGSSLCLNRACDGAVRDHLPHFSGWPVPRWGCDRPAEEAFTSTWEHMGSASQVQLAACAGAGAQRVAQGTITLIRSLGRTLTGERGPSSLQFRWTLAPWSPLSLCS